MRLRVLISIFLAPICLSVPIPDAEPEARAQDPSMLMLNSMTLLPLLLAGAAFAKGYLFGNIKNLKSAGQYGGYGHRLGNPYGYAQHGYGRRISVEGPNLSGSFGGEYTPPGIYGGDYTSSQGTTEFTPSDTYEEYNTPQQAAEYTDAHQHQNTDYPSTLQALHYSPYQFHNYGY